MNKALGLLGLIFIFAGLGLSIVALATSNWSEKGDQSVGFFQTCDKYEPISAQKGVLCYINLAKENREDFEKNDWWLATVGSYCGGVLFGFIGMVLWFSALCSSSAGVRGGALITLIISFAGLLCGLILWKFKYADAKHKDWDDGYSFWVAVGATGGIGIATILCIVAAIAHRKK